jgi:hypothetical protein
VSNLFVNNRPDRLLSPGAVAPDDTVDTIERHYIAQYYLAQSPDLDKLFYRIAQQYPDVTISVCCC